MSYTFGKPRPALPQTIAGEVPPTEIVLSLLTRVKLVVCVPGDLARAGEDTPPDFEPGLRAAVAAALVGTEAGGFAVRSAAVEQFEDAGR